MPDMDGWQAVQNWAIFGIAVGGLAWYYYPQEKKIEKQQEKFRPREQAQTVKPNKPVKQHQPKRSTEKPAVKATPTPAASSERENKISHDAEEDSARSFAEQMMKARQGTSLKAPDKSETRVRTVKQGKAQEAPIEATASSRDASGVADMLEPTAAGPASIRVTAPQQPVKERAPKQSKKEAVETKKQRQNRQKNEAKKELREEEEKQRKELEERQRRIARESRGEPAKNGIPVSKSPASSPWLSSQASVKPATANGVAHAPLLDTFDAESTSSSNAGVSTAATSTTEAQQAQWVDELPSEEEQLALFKAQDDWNEVKSSKKQKKKTNVASTIAANESSAPVVAAPVINSKPIVKAVTAPKPLVNGKPIGFQALTDELDSNDFHGDPNDASSWAA